LEEIAQTGASQVLFSTRNNAGDQIKENEMDGACGTCGRKQRHMQRFGRET
jgi:hypothetical protein